MQDQCTLLFSRWISARSAGDENGYPAVSGSWPTLGSIATSIDSFIVSAGKTIDSYSLTGPESEWCRSGFPRSANVCAEQSVEEYVSEDWAAVAKAVDERLKELGWSQQELAKQSSVSIATVRQIHRNTVNRNRNRLTLKSLSVALGWHPEHIDAVLHGRQPPSVEEPENDQAILVRRMDALEQRMDTMSGQLNEIQTALATVIELLGHSGSRPES